MKDSSASWNKTRLVQAFNNPIYSYLLLAVIVLLAAVLRFYKLGEWSFWIEEHHSLRHAANLNSLDKILTSIRPLFYLLIQPVFAALGVSEWSARLVPAVVGIITVPVLFWLTKRLLGLPVAFLVAILLVVAPWHLYWSQNARFYTLLLLFYTLSLFAFYWGIETGRFRYIIFSLVTLVLGVATHGIAVFVVPVIVAYFLLLKILPFEKPPGLRFRNLAPYFLLPLAGYLLFEGYRIFIAGVEPLASVLYRQFFDQSTASFVGYSGPYVMLTAVVYYIGAPLAFLSLPGTFYLLQKEKRRSGLFLALGAFLPLLIMMALTLFASTANRYVFMTLPFWLILGATAVYELYRRARRTWVGLAWIAGILLLLLRDPVIKDLVYYARQNATLIFLLAAGFLLFMLIAFWLYRTYRQSAFVGLWGIVFVLLIHPIVVDGLYYTYQHGHRDNWKAISTVIKQERKEGDLVVSFLDPLAVYYLQDEVTNISDVDMDAVLQKNERVWFIEDVGVAQVVTTFDEWAAANCTLVDTEDVYTAGQNWKLRAHLCASTVQSSLK